ncbi:MAG: phosphate acyltransferase PlsX [Alphaproteobacteria bacterium]|nr:phosphate acyltransferase PlsX [Alphaproteobacteria bacterium]
MTIALDAMGGDKAPDAVVAGANIARKRHPEVRFVFFGDAKLIEPRLRRFKSLAKVARVVNAPEVVAADARPSQVVRTGRDTSMWKAVEAVRDGAADGVVSAGNTGALMAAAMFTLRTLPDIDRPAIAGFMPSLRGETVLLDLGANVKCDARNLVQFAVMGEVYCRTLLGAQEPKVALLNVGTEETKGNEILKEAAEILAAADLPVTFCGFVEGDDITAGTVDVIVTDGFTGNVALKTVEGAAKLIGQYIRQSFRSSLMAGIGYLFARRAFAKMRRRTDPRRYNGAMLLGLNGICVKSHGGTDALGFATAIGVAVDMVRNDANELIAEHLGKVDLGPTRGSEPAIKVASS